MSLNGLISKFIITTIRLTGFYFLLLVTACSTVNKPDAVANLDVEWLARQTKLSLINNWNINARLSITNKAEVWHLSVKWRQQKQNYKIHLSGPFGAGAVQLEGNQSGVLIQTSDGNRYASDAEQLLFETSGVQMPIQNLYYWIRGLPSPKSDVTKLKLDSFGRLQKLSQNDWNIRFKRYSKVRDVYLPSKIFIKKGDLDIRMIIEDWSISI